MLNEEDICFLKEIRFNSHMSHFSVALCLYLLVVLLTFQLILSLVACDQIERSKQKQRAMKVLQAHRKDTVTRRIRTRQVLCNISRCSNQDFLDFDDQDRRADQDLIARLT